ncbi:putative adenylate synthase [Vitreoscilla sp. C1]|uniref:F390 synthetase-related protein n=1 Tax=Vitreoscilla sp. (strain C1) TaxID=96942 RepID=UPI00148ED673|nr:F390 synthetase-related protein [Vitreoscilla sp. C1]AUZ04904.2 putative adenylate synthase [Vitreoscilla sp. C1]
MKLLRLLWSYWQTKRLSFQTRQALESYQQQKWQQFAQRTLIHSPYFKPYVGQDLADYPLMNKAVMLQHFDAMNTAGLRLQDAFAVAMRAEKERDFAPTLQGFSVGLSSGTSHQRGVFVVSEAEQAHWAGVILAKLLPQGLLAGERVALVLRANNNLYETIDNRFIAFQFFDLLQPFDNILQQLQAYQPSIIVAPAQVLRALALAKQRGEHDLKPKQVISAAEVLSERDAALITEVLGHVQQVYQATEGFLAVTCTHGRLHLNEALLMVEPEWLDETRFIPIITDFSRTTQPIVRYRLDDILHNDPRPCPCGQVTRVISQIEGRLNDVLALPKVGGGVVSVFADALERIMAQNLPLVCDYQLTQTSDNNVFLAAEVVDMLALNRLQDALKVFLQQQGVNVAALQWQLSLTLPDIPMSQKRRRIQVQR